MTATCKEHSPATQVDTGKSRILTSIRGLDVRKNFSATSSRGRSFFLDISSYRPCYEGFPYLADSKVGRSFRDLQDDFKSRLAAWSVSLKLCIVIETNVLLVDVVFCLQSL